ncbi:MAG TPA: hypothetical protein VGP65_04220 [Candidatus Angelobacter sp.]|jgi:hypothetical protein|nr:hypothetical protein [Candidatus Angelobacter sp.]
MQKSRVPGWLDKPENSRSKRDIFEEHMSLLQWWRNLYSENPKAKAMFFRGLGIGQVMAAFLVWEADPSSPGLFALTTFSLVFACMSAVHWRRAAKVN